jgi:hypothetical protein
MEIFIAKKEKPTIKEKSPAAVYTSFIFLLWRFFEAFSGSIFFSITVNTSSYYIVINISTAICYRYLS